MFLLFIFDCMLLLLELKLDLDLDFEFDLILGLLFCCCEMWKLGGFCKFVDFDVL